VRPGQVKNGVRGSGDGLVALTRLSRLGQRAHDRLRIAGRRYAQETLAIAAHATSGRGVPQPLVCMLVVRCAYEWAVVTGAAMQSKPSSWKPAAERLVPAWPQDRPQSASSIHAHRRIH